MQGGVRRFFAVEWNTTAQSMFCVMVGVDLKR